MIARRETQRGSITPMVAFGTVILCVMGIGGATIGRIVQSRREVQRVADSAALAAADEIRVNGVDGDRSGALSLAHHNSPAPTTASIDGVASTPHDLEVSTLAGQGVDTPRFIFDGNAQVKAAARAMVAQEFRKIDSSKTANVVFVLDFSGSMNDALGGETKIKVLKDSITGYLRDQRIPLNYSAALFSSDLIDSVGFGPNASQQIIDMFQNHGADGGTMPQFGFDKASEFLGPPGTGPDHYVVFASDGQPNDLPAAQAGSSRMWDTSKPEVLTLHIGDPEAAPFMISVAGTWDHRGNKDDYFPVEDMDEFRKALAQILAKIACPLDPPTLDKARLKDANTVNAFLRDSSGHEVKLPTNPQIDGSPDQLAFFFNPASLAVGVSIQACVLMRNEHRTLVIRYNRAALIQ